MTGETRERRFILPDGAEVGRVEVPWQANVYVLVEEGGTVQVRHGAEDQRGDPIRLDRYLAAELAYWLLCASERDETLTLSYHRDLARLRVAFRQIREIGGREYKEDIERLRRAMSEERGPDRAAHDD